MSEINETIETADPEAETAIPEDAQIAETNLDEIGRASCRERV